MTNKTISGHEHLDVYIALRCDGKIAIEKVFFKNLPNIE